MIHDASHSCTYDAENRLTQVDGGATVAYVYDAEGRRVAKTAGSTVTNYIYGWDGDVVSGRNANSWLQTYIHFGGGLLPSTVVPLPSFTIMTTSAPSASPLLMSLGTTPTFSISDSMDYLPFREQIAGANTTSHKLTGKEHDLESGLDNFGARYDSSSLGRFMTPDWSAAPMGVPYADFGDPQSLNLYSYTKNNPLNHVDADGHCIFGRDTLGCAAVVVAVAAVSYAIYKGIQAYFHGSEGLNWLKSGEAARGSIIDNATSPNGVAASKFSADSAKRCLCE